MDLELETLAEAALVAGGTAILLMAFVGGLALLLRPRGERTGRALIGTVAEVTVAIPSGGVGVVVHGAAGRRSVRPARHVDGVAAEAGARVIVVDVVDGVARVRTLPPELLEVFR